MVERILVVDDEPRICELASMILEDAGYFVITAKNGLDAIRKAEEEVVDLVILDFVMPGISGLETCRIMKSQASTRSIPVVMFTVLDRQKDHELAKEAGCDGYLIKPFNPEELLKEVRRHLKKSGQSAR